MKILSLTLLCLLLFCPTLHGAERRFIVNGPIVVNPGQFVSFVCGNRYYDSRISGSFRARGGSGNDIIVLILDADAYENWINGHASPSGCYYNSGKVTVGRFDVNVPPGFYRVVYSNAFSSVSNKVVETQVVQEN